MREDVSNDLFLRGFLVRISVKGPSWVSRVDLADELASLAAHAPDAQAVGLSNGLARNLVDFDD